jgi:hypothetical protein
LFLKGGFLYKKNLAGIDFLYLGLKARNIKKGREIK